MSEQEGEGGGACDDGEDEECNGKEHDRKAFGKCGKEVVVLGIEVGEDGEEAVDEEEGREEKKGLQENGFE